LPAFGFDLQNFLICFAECFVLAFLHFFALLTFALVAWVEALASIETAARDVAAMMTMTIIKIERFSSIRFSFGGVV
jgi:hypothetical protein